VADAWVQSLVLVEPLPEREPSRSEEPLQLEEPNRRRPRAGRSASPSASVHAGRSNSHLARACLAVAGGFLLPRFLSVSSSAVPRAL
jgi:hypothetical protein